MTLTFRDYLFTLTEDVTVSSIESIRGSSLRATDHSTWELAKRFECPHSVKFLAEDGIDVDTHEVIGEYYRDLTHWCDIEKKIEYCHDHFLLLAPKKVMAEFRVDYTFEDIAAEHGFSEWA